MNHQCDKCENKASHHSVEIINGEKIEKHLCDFHADQEGMTIKDISTPINELLTQFVKLHSQQIQTGATKTANEYTCPNCKTSFSDFKSNKLLGCAQCYSAFESKLDPILERVHEGHCHHVGKVPKNAGENEQKQMKISRMQKFLEKAVAEERYEIAAQLRDEIKALEEAS